MPLESQFIIKEEKYTLSIIKKNKPENINSSWGITIFKKNLELNILNEDNINMILKTKKYISSFANLGLISLAGVICFAYSTIKDVEQVGFLNFVKVYKIKNINYIILDPDMKEITKSHIQKLFVDFTNSEVNKGLYFFNESILNFDLSFDKFCHHIYDNNSNFYHINKKINFCYNYDYITYFRNFSLEDFTTKLMQGFFYQKIIKYLKNENIIIYLIIRNKTINNNENINIKQTFHELEIILSSNNFEQIFHFKFYLYIGDYSLNKNILYNLLKEYIYLDKKDNGAVIIFDIIDKINEKNNEEKDIFLKEFENNNDNFIFIQKKEDINNVIEKNINILEEIKFNFEKDQMKIDNQEKQLLLISDKECNYLSIIESILLNLKYKYFNKNKEIIQEKEIYSYVKEAFISYKNYIIDKNKNSSKLCQIKSEPLNEDYLKKYILFRIQKTTQNKKNLEKCSKQNNIINNNINIINEEKNENININTINDIKEKDDIQNIKNKKFYIYIVTYNLNNINLNSDLNIEILLNELLFPKNAQKYFSINGYPTFYCIGFQEIVKLNTSNIILFSGKNSADFWETKIAQILQTNYNYTLQYTEHLVGVQFLFFVKTSKAKEIKNTKKSIKKSGFLNTFGNKGSLFYEFIYKDRSFSFCTGHLTAGANTKKYKERVSHFIDILNHQKDKYSIKFYKNNYYFIFGDLNFRVKTNKNTFFNKVDEINSNIFNIKDKNINNEMKYFSEIKDEVEKKEKFRSKSNFEIIIDKSKYLEEEDDSDEEDKKDKNNKTNKKNRKINEEKFRINFFNDFSKNEELTNLKSILEQYEIKEKDFDFLPTYKYYKGTNYYNVTKRIPAWTDRILFKVNNDLKCLIYDVININYSDHKPVYGLFELEFKDDKNNLNFEK